MNWVVYSLIAITFMGSSDFFRKLASSSKNAAAANLYFQCAAALLSIIIFVVTTDRSVALKPLYIFYAVIGGALISLFTVFSFKALANGPGVSTVMPILRIGGVSLAAVLGILILREKLSMQTALGFLFAITGIYLLFSGK